MSAPAVSVILPVFNGAAHLPHSAGSVLDQSFKDFELLIVDDGSRDNSLEVAKQIADRHPGRVRVLQQPGGTNRGVAAARNIGLCEARAALIAFLDADDRWHPEKLQRQVQLMQQHPEVGLSMTRARIVREDVGHRFVPGKEILGDAPPVSRRLAMVQVITCQMNYIFSTVMARAACLREIGGFDERLPYQSEDRILVAMVAARHRLGLCPDVLCDYIAHGESYTAGVLRSGIASAIFFDLQTRITLWLRRQGCGRWAWYVAFRVLPDFFVHTVAGVRRPAALLRAGWNLLRIGLRYPALLPRALVHTIRHSRLGPILGMKRKPAPRPRTRRDDLNPSSR